MQSLSLSFTFPYFFLSSSSLFEGYLVFVGFAFWEAVVSKLLELFFSSRIGLYVFKFLVSVGLGYLVPITILLFWDSGTIFFT